jgi:hypothetical protein
MNILDRINSFGAIDAENDQNLLDYFYETPVLGKLFSYEKAIVIGRKGTGKTALYRYIETSMQDQATALVFRDYPWDAHDRFKNESVSESESYLNAWVFFFYIEIFKKLVSLERRFTTRAGRKAIKQLKKWLKKNWGRIDFDHREVMLPKAKRWQWKLAPQILGNSLGSLSPIAGDSQSMGHTLSEFNRKFEKALQDLMLHYDGNVALLFDELDLAYSHGDVRYQSRLTGILLAAYVFFQKHRKKIRIYLFLRNDIFSILDFQDKNKIKDNMVEFLDWDPENINSELSLKTVISNRISVNIDSKSDNFERNWAEIFDDAKIGRHQFKWNFIVDRSFIRPRDVIKFMNLALEQAKNRLKNQPESVDKITNDDIHEIRAKYSTYLFEELRDEIVAKYRDFNAYFEILRDVHKMTFTLEDFQSSYKSVDSRMSIDSTADQVLERLYEFSVIGFYKPGGGGYGGAEYRYQYTSDHQPFNPRAQFFKVQPGFKEHLELVEG